MATTSSVPPFHGHEHRRVPRLVDAAGPPDFLAGLLVEAIRLSLSTLALMMTRSPCMTGEAAEPQPLNSSPTSDCQSCLPLRSKANAPVLPKNTYSRSPSVAGVLVAYPWPSRIRLLLGQPGLDLGVPEDLAGLAVEGHEVETEILLVSLAATGDVVARVTGEIDLVAEDDGAGAAGAREGVFQTMLSVLLQVVGRLVAELVPRPPGPRNCRQSAAWPQTTQPAANQQPAAKQNGFMSKFSAKQIGPVGLLGLIGPRGPTGPIHPTDYFPDNALACFTSSMNSAR